MPLSAATRWTALRLAMAAVLLLAASASPASASCGDYVHVLTPGQTAAQPGAAGPSVAACAGGPTRPANRCHPSQFRSVRVSAPAFGVVLHSLFRSAWPCPAIVPPSR